MISYRYEVFYAVAANLSFSKAAALLFTSQPAVSKQIKQLEHETGVALFLRQGNSVQLTAAGHKLYDSLKKAKPIQREIQSDFATIKSQFETKGELKIGASTTISLYVMPKILASLHKKLPLVKVLLMNRNSERILRALIDQEIDIACIESSHKLNAVQYQFFMKDEIIPVCASQSPFVSNEIALDKLSSLPIVLREQGSGTLDVLTKAFKNQNIKITDLNVIARLGGTEALKNYLIAGEAIGFLPRRSVKTQLDSGELKEIKIPNFTVQREFNFVIRKGEDSIGLIRQFIKESKLVYNL